MNSESSSLYAVVLAGGSGQRFWPLSRDRMPKQLLKLFGNKTLLEHTMDRLKGLVPRENIVVLTNEQQFGAVRRVLRGFPSKNILAEPEKRDTAPAIALGIGWVAARDPKATMMVLPSDHWIKDRKAFQKTVRTACAAARQSQALVTIGIKPTWACPGYGYIERGAASDVPGVHKVKHFREKPKPELAQRYLDRGGFLWNAGMFFWSVPDVRKIMATHSPKLAGFVRAFAGSKEFDGALKAKFSSLPKLSIDYALMEKAPRVLNVEAGFDWDDVGSWISVAGHLNLGAGGNRQNCIVSQHDSNNNIVFSKSGQHVALLGAQDLVVISTRDALLVAHRSQAEQLKKLVEGLPKKLR